MLLFRDEEHVLAWCRARSVAPGATFSLEQGWGLATAWFVDRLSPSWRRRTAEEAESVFAGLGLTGGFWRLRP